MSVFFFCVRPLRSLFLPAASAPTAAPTGSGSNEARDDGQLPEKMPVPTPGDSCSILKNSSGGSRGGVVPTPPRWNVGGWGSRYCVIIFYGSSCRKWCDFACGASSIPDLGHLARVSLGVSSHTKLADYCLLEIKLQSQVSSDHTT